MITDLRLRGVGAGLRVADPLLSLSAVTTAGTLAVSVSLPLPSSTPRTARPELSPLTPACQRSLLITRPRDLFFYTPKVNPL